MAGSFLAKGANDPFGGIYIWIFEHVPGFVMFRDPTKFLMIVALSYAVLIPNSLSELPVWVNSNFKIQIPKLQFKVKNILTTAFLAYWLFLIYPALSGQLGGTFQPKQVPGDYVVLTSYLASQPEFFRTFWIPARQRFAYFSNQHPAIDSTAILNKSKPEEAVEWIKNNPSARDTLSGWHVRYLIVKKRYLWPIGVITIR